jgi:hypothetical protein
MSDRGRYWQRLVSVWERSGLSQAEFCRRRKIKAVTFGWWKRKLKGPGDRGGRHAGRGGTGKAAGHGKQWARQEADFVELALPGNALAVNPPAANWVTSSAAPRSRWTLPAVPGSRAHHYEIALGSGRVIRVPQDFDPAVVSQLIAVAESC